MHARKIRPEDTRSIPIPSPSLDLPTHEEADRERRSDRMEIFRIIECAERRVRDDVVQSLIEVLRQEEEANHEAPGEERRS